MGDPTEQINVFPMVCLPVHLQALRPSPKSSSGRVHPSCLFTGYHLCIHYQKLQGGAVLNQTQDREPQEQRPLTDQSLSPLAWSSPDFPSSLYAPFLSVCLSVCLTRLCSLYVSSKVQSLSYWGLREQCGFICPDLPLGRGGLLWVGLSFTACYNMGRARVAPPQRAQRNKVKAGEGGGARPHRL